MIDQENTIEANILRAVANVAEWFLRSEWGADWDRVVRRALAELGTAARVDRVVVFARRPHSERVYLHLAYEWTAPGVAPRGPLDPEDELKSWSELGFGRWAESMARGGIICGAVRTFPEAERYILESKGVVSTLSVPIFVQGEWWGFIGFDACRYEREWSPAEVNALRAAANILAAALQRHRVEEQALRHADALAIVGDIIKALNASPQVTDAFPTVVAGVRRLSGCDRVSLTLLEDDPRWFRVVALDQPRVELNQGVRLAVEDTSVADDVLAGRVHLTPSLAQELQKPAEQALYQAGHRARVNIPLKVQGRVLGSLNLAWPTEQTFSEDLIHFLQDVADALALALERTFYYEAALKANEELRRALNVRSEIVRTVSHELRTPLTLVVGSAELLAERHANDLPERDQELIRTIVQQARHVSYLVNEFLSFHKVEEMEMVLREVDVRRLLENVVSSWYLVFEKAGQHLQVEIAPDVGKVQGHTDLLMRVLNNLLDNARKYSPPGSTTTLNAWVEGDEVFIAIQDQGIGVPPDMLPRIFERFYQVERPERYPTSGLGLGLALCKEIVERHNGRIWAESEGPGTGLRVVFTLRRVH